MIFRGLFQDNENNDKDDKYIKSDYFYRDDKENKEADDNNKNKILINYIIDDYSLFPWPHSYNCFSLKR